MVSVMFHNGAIVTAPTWTELERTLRSDDWNPDDKMAYRVEMARRARVWSETSLQKKVTPREFIEQLEAAGLLRIVSHDQEGIDA